MKAVVLGAGVAGLTSALSLRKLGFDVVVHEKRAASDVLGAGVVCWPNASFVLERLGLLEILIPLGGRPRSLLRLNKKGDVLDAWDIEKLDRHMGFPSVALLRRDLMRVLIEAVSKVGIELRFGCGAISMKKIRARKPRYAWSTDCQSQGI